MASSGTNQNQKKNKSIKSKESKEKKYYVVSHGRQNGIYTDWNTGSRYVTGFPKAKFKGYTSLQEAIDVLTRNFVNPIYVYEGKSKNPRTVEDYCKNNNIKITISDVSQIHATLSDKGIIIYTDGACKDNGKPAKCSFAVFSNDFDQPSYAYNLDTPRPTNNVAELAGCIMAIKSAINLQLSCITIKTDSLYVVNSATMYLHDWIKITLMILVTVKSGKPAMNYQNQLQLHLKMLMDIVVKKEMNWLIRWLMKLCLPILPFLLMR